MSTHFKIDSPDMKKLEKFFRDSPRDFQRASANVLTSHAFLTRKYDIENISRGMIVRSPRFVSSSLRYDKAKPVSINSQIAYAYSVERQGFSGWKEQQDGTPAKKDRAGTINARKGNPRNVMSGESRFSSKNKFYKISQFRKSTKNDTAAFAFMMRYIATKGKGFFLLTENLSTKAGTLGRGLYSFIKHKIKRVQKLGGLKQPKTFKWRTHSLDTLQNTNDIKKIWDTELNRVMAKAGIKK